MGKVISGRYEEIEQLGHGGQGVVYKVRHLKHKTVLALKALPSYFLANPVTIGRLEQEALVLTRLRHRNIVQVVGSGRDEALGLIYIVMEYVEGKTLKEYVQEKGSLPLPEVLEITRQVGNALAYTHGQTPPVIHRDIKPSNIIIEDFSGRVVLLDFGIAKELGEASDSHTRTGYMVGTWKYSSPEQLRHEPLTGSADIYSLGMVMYEMYTGTPFFSGRDEPSVLGKILHDPHEYELSFPHAPIPAFVELLQKAVAKSRDKRYANMEDFLRDVDACWSLLDETRIAGLNESPFTRPPPFRDPADGEATVVQNFETQQTRSAGHASGPEVDRDIETIDAEIRKLQEERQQRFVLSLQARVKEAREKAEQAGAKQWAEARLEQGYVQENQANALFRAAQYAAAQENFETALVSFTQANEETIRAKLRSRAEQARREVEIAKSDADRQGAGTLALETYTRAQELVAEAEVRFKQEVYEEALKQYADARSVFEDARDLAYRETRRQEANAARLEASTARESALSEGAETLASAIVEEAQRNEQQAAAALAREEFTQARVLYLAASQKYEQAQRRAHFEHVQREVTRAAQTAEEAQRRVLASGENANAQPLYRQALEAQQRATALREAREYDKATQEYGNARRWYDEVRAALLAAVRQQVAEVQQRAHSARSQAEQAQAREKARSVYERAVALQAHADDCVVKETYQDAIQGYEQALATFIAASETATTQSLREQAIHAQEQMQNAEKAASEAHAETLASEMFTQGKDAAVQANTALEQADFPTAQTLYESAQQHYMQAEDRARVERRAQWQQAMHCAQQALARQDRVRAADPAIGSHPQYRQADELYQRAQTHLAAEEYDVAERLYQQVQEQYEALLQLIEDERADQILAEARQRLERAQESAEQAGARQRLGTQWEQAVNRVHTAHQYEQQGDRAEAEACYRDAEQQFVRMAEKMAQQTAREEERRQVTLARKQEVTTTRTVAEEAEVQIYAQDMYRRAILEERNGDEALAVARWEEAERHFSHAQEHFATAIRGAQQRKEARDQAYQAKRQAIAIRNEVLVEQATALFPERVATVQALEANAEQELRRADFSRAQRDFTQVAELLLQLDHDVKKQVQQTPASDDQTRIADSLALGRPQVEKAQDADEATVIITSSPVPLPMPVRVPDNSVPVGVEKQEFQTVVHVTPSHPLAPERPFQKYVVIGAAFLAILAGLYVAHLGSLEDSPPQPGTVGPLQSEPTSTSPGAPPQSQVIRPLPTAPSQAKPEEPNTLGVTPSQRQKSAAQAKGSVTEPSTSSQPSPPAAPPSVMVALPRIVGFTPAEDKKIIIAEGGRQTFTVVVKPASPKSLWYDWYVGESKLKTTTEGRWTYAPGANEGSAYVKAITVVLRNGEQELDRKSWTNVLVTHQPLVPKMTNLSPQPGKAITAAFGEELPFSVEVDDPGGVAEQPTWLLDNQKVGQGKSQRVRIPAEGATHVVTVVLANGIGGKTATAEWNIVIPTALQPSVVDARPKGDVITTQVGRVVEFSAVVELPVRLSGYARPQIEWSVDGTVRQTKEAQQFRFAEEQEGVYVVTAVGVSRDGVRGTPKKWTVRVRLPESPLSANGRLELTKDEVRAWVERYRRALEQKDGKMLEDLGLDKLEIRERIEDVERNEDLVIKIEVQDQDIQLDGQPPRRAQVRFTRRDVRDGVQTAPGAVRYTLEKLSNGRVIVAR